MEARRSPSMAGQSTVPQIINILAGIWLIIAPFVLSFTGHRGATWDSVIVGIVVIILAALCLWGTAAMAWLSWVIAILGVWMIISPWIFSASDVNAVLWSDILAGIVAVVFGVLGALMVREHASV